MVTSYSRLRVWVAKVGKNIAEVTAKRSVWMWGGWSLHVCRHWLDFPLAISCWPSANGQCGLVRADEWNKVWLEAGARMSFHAVSTNHDNPNLKTGLPVFLKAQNVLYRNFKKERKLILGGKVFTFERKLGCLWLAFWRTTYESNQGAPHPPRSCSGIMPNYSGWCQLLVYDWCAAAAMVTLEYWCAN